MERIHTLLTFDYEIFGNGTGDVKGCLVDPTRNILQLLKKYDVRATFFVDVCLIWALQDNYDCDTFRHHDIHPLSLIENQLAAILSEGHDIQLHAHPQLINAPHDGIKFDVNYDNWRIIDLPYDEDFNKPSIMRILSEGKTTLTELCRRTLPGYRVIAFRAGGLCSRPEKMLLKGLRRNEIFFDFSGSYNFRCDSWPGKVDYADVFSAPEPVLVGETYNDKRKVSDLALFPIYGAKYYYYRSELTARLWNKIRRNDSLRSWRKKRPEGAKGDTIIPGFEPEPQKKPKYFERVMPSTIHFYIENSLHDMVWCANDALKRHKKGKTRIYMVGIGHPKAMGDLSQLELFFQWARNHHDRDIFQFTVVRELLGHSLVKIP